MVKPQTKRQRRWREGLYEARDRAAELEKVLDRILDEIKIPASGYSHFKIRKIVEEAKRGRLA